VLREAANLRQQILRQRLAGEPIWRWLLEQR